MSRPVGVTLAAAALLCFSIFIAYRALPIPGGRRHHALAVALLVLVGLGLVAAEALWSLRPHAFVAFVAWGLAAIIALALQRLASPAGAHAARIVPGLVYAGLAFAAAAIYLRRAV